MDESIIRVLVVDDYQPWHDFISSTIRERQDLQIVAHSFDGLDAVQKAEKLRPDLVILDIGLPQLNGIEVARQIHKLSPSSKIIFLSEHRDPEIAKEALRAQGHAYVVKSRAGGDLLAALSAVLRDELFVSSSLESDVSSAEGQHGNPRAEIIIEKVSANFASRSRHEMALYADDASLVTGFARFIAAALRVGKVAIVVATESHRAAILQRLSATFDICAAIKQGRYIPLNVADILATFMSDELPDPIRFRKAAGELIMGAAKATNLDPSRVAACGECAPILLDQGKAEAAIQLEHLWDEVARRYDVDILCGYAVNETQRSEHNEALSRICAEHSVVHGN